MGEPSPHADRIVDRLAWYMTETERLQHELAKRDVMLSRIKGVYRDWVQLFEELNQ
jgi:hypothetical protein